jgi:2-C-methyl-D-erythritol 4-phosphate cytidylyltransferase
MAVIAVVPAAGNGTRLGLGTPKAFVELDGRTLLRRAVDGLIDSGTVDQVVVAVPESLLSADIGMPTGIVVVAGGAERTDSVRNALAAVDADPADLVLVHDAARPLTPPAMIARVVGALHAGAEAVIPVLAVADTIKQVDRAGRVRGTVDRDVLRAVQTPQGFTVAALRAAYAAARDLATDDAGLVERLGGVVQTVLGDPLAMKITTPFDLRVAQALVKEV